MIWVFATAVMVLTVYNEWFRTLVLWCSGAVAAFFLFGAIVSGVFTHLH